MSIMNTVKEGADITHPKPTVGYILGAIVAFAVLGVAYWMFQKAKGVIKAPVSTMTTGLESQASQQLDGFL